MKPYPMQFLGADALFSEWERAAVAILPFPYEKGASYGKGAALAPEAVIEASRFLELYDETLRAEPCRMGIATVMPPPVPGTHQEMFDTVYQATKTLLEGGKFVVLLGGDHSISSGFFKALSEIHGTLSAVQLDAHADLRDSYEGSRLSHACVMSRIREFTDHTLQIGIRSMSRGESERIAREKIPLCTMQAYRRGGFDLEGALRILPEPVYLTVDVDVFDWSVIRSTGTPEPGGFGWDEALALLEQVFYTKKVVALDVVELSYSGEDRNSPFAAAKLIYKMLGFKLAAEVARGELTWPEAPRGPLFR